MWDYVRVRRTQIDLEAGRQAGTVVSQDRAPGMETEVDFGEVYIILGDVKTKCHMFVYRLSHFGKVVHRVCPTSGQEAFLEEHIEAFHVLSSIPTHHIRYDNLISVVVQVIHDGDRLRDKDEHQVLFHSHYGSDTFYCQPGANGAHEGGGIEGKVGWFRRNHLTPMPEVAILDELNNKICVSEHNGNTCRIAGHTDTIGQDHHAELPHLTSLPANDFDLGLILHPRVGRSALVTVRMVKYSVPAHLTGQRVRVSLRASCVVVFESHTVLATHLRLDTHGVTRVGLDRYLEVLRHGPSVFPGSTALVQARTAGVFTAARKTSGDMAGTQVLIGVLLLHRSLPSGAVIADITSALSAGVISPDVVTAKARRHATTHTSTPASQIKGGTVVDLPPRRPTNPHQAVAHLPKDTRSLPTAAAYDELLCRRQPDPAPAPPRLTTTPRQEPYDRH